MSELEQLRNALLTDSIMVAIKSQQEKLLELSVSSVIIISPDSIYESINSATRSELFMRLENQLALRMNQIQEQFFEHHPHLKKNLNQRNDE